MKTVQEILIAVVGWGSAATVILAKLTMSSGDKVRYFAALPNHADVVSMYVKRNHLWSALGWLIGTIACIAAVALAASAVVS